MKIESSLLNELAKALEAERKHQKLSREEAASVCGVSASFIRDVEANPENCSLGKLVRLIGGLGLSLNVAGLLPAEDPNKERLKKPEKLGLHVNVKPKTRAGLGLHLPNLSRRPDFGVSDDQIVNPNGIRRPMGLDVVPLKGKGDKS